MVNLFKTMGDAYVFGLQELLTSGVSVPSVTDPFSIASNFGVGDRPAIESLAFSFAVDNPEPCLLSCSPKIFDIPYQIGLFLWTIAGSESLEWLNYYNPIAKRFSSDGELLCGAFGKRLFSYKGCVDQMAIIEDRLSQYPSTRRAFGSILSAQDNESATFDYPCAIGVQYFIRNDTLFATTFMRAQQALTVLPFDCFVFMGLQALLASKLGIPCGRYFHVCGTFHFYESERILAERISLSRVKSVSLGPMSGGVASLEKLLQFEAELRKATLTGDRATVDGLTSVRFDAGGFYESARVLLMLHAYSLLNLNHLALASMNLLPADLRHLALRFWGAKSGNAES